MSEWFDTKGKALSLDPANRGFQYGDGLFETIAIRGGKPRLWQSHLERLVKGCERLGLETTPDSLECVLDSALSGCEQDTSYCIAKIIVTAASGVRGYGRSAPSPGEIYVGVFPATPRDKNVYRDGVDTMLCETRLATGSPVAGLKTINRIEQVLASSECRAAGLFEGFTRDADDRLICGTISNVFIVTNNRIRTPSLDRCGVEGTMRRLVIDLLNDQGTGVEVCDLAEDDLAAADEVFITNSQMGAVPVRRCGDYEWDIGSTTHRVLGLLADFGIEECRA
ncbi:MAG: aminodeoxychorismate lyase [Gammaproteobacteria bacterium]|nr:aminodeoxychorismate lyase [Gammaproteobacteria bacterium]